MDGSTQTRQDSDLIRVHDLMTAFEGLTVPGLAFYADRALVLPGTTYVADGPIDDHLGYLGDVGIGAREIVRVAGGELVRNLATVDGLRADLARRVQDGGRLQFFVSTGYEAELLSALGIDWSRTFSAPVGISLDANDKAALRRLADRLGMRHAFPVHRMCRPTDTAAVYKTVGELMAGDGCDFAVIKRPDLASGDGMIIVPRSRDWADAVDPYLRKHAGAPEIIVEAGHEHVPISIQWEFESDGPRFACVSSQLLDERFVHLGNVVGSRELPDISDADERVMRQLTEPFARHYWERGYRGICGFDLMRSRRDGRIYLLECNGRVTATTYAVGVGRQVADRCDAWTVLMTNVSPNGAVRDFAALRERLGSWLFDGRKGVLPFNVRCLGLPEPKCTVCCVGADASEAETFLLEARRRLA